MRGNRVHKASNTKRGFSVRITKASLFRLHPFKVTVMVDREWMKKVSPLHEGFFRLQCPTVALANCVYKIHREWLEDSLLVSFYVADRISAKRIKSEAKLALRIAAKTAQE